MLKKVCEQNGHLGFMIREALQAYLKGSWWEHSFQLLFNCPHFIISSGPHYLSPPLHVCCFCVDNRQEALVKYILAAETGLGLAQSNAAYLCEVHSMLFLCF